MRPKDLKFPFTWNERKPTFYQGVLIIPQYYDSHHLWKDEMGLLLKKKSIHIEYCSGNGDWVLEKAIQNPSQFWVAVEMQFKRVKKIWSKMRNRGIENLLIVCGEGLTFTRHYLQSGIATEAFINFPDPWPKDRHAKHRIIQQPFVEELARILKKEGTATYATDDADYSRQMIDEMTSHQSWKSRLPKPYFIQDWEDYGSSWFENLLREKGQNFYYMQFEKI